MEVDLAFLAVDVRANLEGEGANDDVGDRFEIGTIDFNDDLNLLGVRLPARVIFVAARLDGDGGSVDFKAVEGAFWLSFGERRGDDLGVERGRGRDRRQERRKNVQS